MSRYKEGHVLLERCEVLTRVKKEDLSLPIWRDERGLNERKMPGVGADSKFQIVVDNKLTVPKRFLSDELVSLLKHRLIFDNPGYFNRLRFGKLKRGEEPWIFCIWASEDGRHLIIPRGFTHDLIQILHGHRLKPELINRTREPQTAGFSFMGSVYGYQLEALRALHPYFFNVLSGGLGTGKKVVALYLAAERRCPVLVIVKTRSQMHQWASLVRPFIQNGSEHIGFIGDGRRDLDKAFTIGIDRSLYRCLPDIIGKVGFLVVDQCHLANLKIFFKIVLRMDCRYMVGLSSVAKRGDGLDRLMTAFLGPRRHKLHPIEEGMCNPRPELVIRKTRYAFDYKEDYGDMVADLIEHNHRNDLIVTDILQETSSPSGRAVLISERLDHLKTLQGLLKANYKEAKILNSRVPEKERIELFEKFDRGALQVLLTTVKSLSQVEVKSVNRFFVSTPVKIGAHISQVISKLIACKGDEPGKIFDYLDNVGVLKASFARRLKFYRLVGFTVNLENPSNVFNPRDRAAGKCPIGALAGPGPTSKAGPLPYRE